MMTSEKQIQMLMRDMLFINWVVEPEIARPLVDPEFELDTVVRSSGKVVAFASAVCFRVHEVRSSVLPIPRLSFEQVNYRVYVKGPEGPSVFFLDMKVNSRMVTALTSFLRVPISYEDIDIAARQDGLHSIEYQFRSPGLRAEVVVGDGCQSPVADPPIEPSLITQRLIGYAKAGGNMYKIEVDHPVLDATPARVHRIEAQRLVELGLLTDEQSARPNSAVYVREALFATSPPARAW